MTSQRRIGLNSRRAGGELFTLLQQALAQGCSQPGWCVVWF
jgi:hypothetical protein